MKHIFIVNKVAGNQGYKDVIDFLDKRSDLDYEIFYTEYEGHAREIAFSLPLGCRIYVVGGDGTAHEVINGMNFENELAIIPVGTGNDFARMYVDKTSIVDILEKTIYGSAKRVDIGKVNDIYFLNCLNIGVDARVNVGVNGLRNRWFPRKLVYIWFAIVEVIKDQKEILTFRYKDKKYKNDIILITIMNGKWYGGGFKSAPNAILDDGYLDVCEVDYIPRHKVFPLLSVYMKGNHEDLDIVKTYRIKNLIIDSERPFIYGCDGELYQAKQLTVEIQESMLKLVMHW